MRPEEMVGKYLLASCSQEEYGRVLAVGKDANGRDVMSILVLHPDDLIVGAKEPGEEHDATGLMHLEMSPGAYLVLHDVPYEVDPKYPENVRCFTPGDDCYRCTSWFSLEAARRDYWPQDVERVKAIEAAYDARQTTQES